MSEVTWQNARSADGRLLIRWLEDRGALSLSETSLGATLARRIHAWRAGHRADFWAVDRVLTRLDLHVSMVPDEVWHGDAARHGERQIHSTRREGPKPRYCERCGSEIPHANRESREAYSVRVFCSSECVKAAKGGWLGMKQRFLPKEDAA